MRVSEIVVLCGGVGAARFLEGVVQVRPPRQVTAIINTGDDATFYGLHVSPDVDIVLYTLAGLVDVERGWGLAGDTFRCQEWLGRYGAETWFQLGDGDLAAHIHRTALLRGGSSLSQVTAEMARRLGVGVRVLPMTNAPVATTVRTPDGWLAFQEYFVRRRARDRVLEVRLDGGDAAEPAPGLLDAIAGAAAVIVAPSNPIVSIGTILAVPDIRQALRDSRARIGAVSPIVGGATIKGPAADMMRTLGHEPSPLGVARLYADFLDVMVLDDVDTAYAESIQALGVAPITTDTIMRGPAEKAALAYTTIDALLAPASQGAGHDGD